MAMRHTNLERRGRLFYYRAAVTLDDKRDAFSEAELISALKRS